SRIFEMPEKILIKTRNSVIQFLGIRNRRPSLSQGGYRDTQRTTQGSSTGHEADVGGGLGKGPSWCLDPFRLRERASRTASRAAQAVSHRLSSACFLLPRRVGSS